MNQINIDSLLSIGSSIKIEPQLKLDSTQLYQALLKIGTDGNTQLQLQTPAGPIKVQLNPNDAQQIRQATTAAPTNNSSMPAETQVSLSAQSQKLQSSQPLPSSLNTLPQAQPTSLSQQSLPTHTLALQVKLQQSSEQAITLQVMKPSQQLQLSEQSVFKLLQQAAQLLPTTTRIQAQAEQQIALAVQLTRSEQKILLQLAGARSSLALPLHVFAAADRAQLMQQLPDAANPSKQTNKAISQTNAVLRLLWQQGQVQLKLQLLNAAETKGLIEKNPSAGTSVDFNAPQRKAAATVHGNQQTAASKSGNLTEDPVKQYRSVPQQANNLTEPAQSIGKQAIADPKFSATGHAQTLQSAEANALQLPIKEKQALASQTPSNAATTSLLASIERESIKTILPLLGKQLLPTTLKMQGQQVQLQPNHPQTATISNWQLKAEGNQWQLDITEPNPLTSLKINPQAFDKPVQWQTLVQLPQQKLSDATKAIDVPVLWRQLLPLQQTLSSLEPTADLPLPVQAVLQELRSKMLDAQKIAQIPEVQAQLNASLQFSPQPTQANPLTAAGSMAIALQLLLGRLTSSDTAKSNPTKDKLQQLIGQLSESQSSQLVRQLAGHSSSLQQAQLASFEHLQNKPEQTQFYLQLPLVVQGQSQFVELAISEREAQNSQDGPQNKAWQLTMKFKLGTEGHLLVQVLLQQNQVAMNFYADSDPTQQLTKQWLPQLMERLQAQGIEVTEAQVQRGKIPEHLYQRGTSLLQIKV